jgi:uncharacterized protein (TIGR00251 family)
MNSWKDAVKQSSQGILISLHVVPGASNEVFPSGYNPWRNCLEIKVRSAASENKANREVLETLAGFFGIAPQDVQLINGLKNREKTVLLKRISFDRVCIILEGALHG